MTARALARLRQQTPVVTTRAPMNRPRKSHLARSLCYAAAGVIALACGGDPGSAVESLGEETEGAGGAEQAPEDSSSEGARDVMAPEPGEADPSSAAEPTDAAEPEPAPEPEAPAAPGEADGVEIDGTCHPICEDPSTDPDGDGWGWENEASCVVAGSAAEARGAPCRGETATPPAAPSGASQGYLVDGECMPECALDSDEDGDGWGWENEASCVVAGSAAATGRARCGEVAMEPEIPEDPVSPTPAGDAEPPDGAESSGFFVSEGRLYDANGNDFVIRGINHGHYWFRDEMDTAFQAIADTGANAIRIVWESQGSAEELRSALSRSVDLELVPIIELHDVTGDMSNESLLNMARYYTGADVLAVLKEFEHTLLVNVANEWSGDDWLGGYQAAIAEMRDAGILHTLVVDSNGWGQNAETVLNDGQALLDSDPQQNLLFSVHMYESFSSESAITSALQGAVDRRLPLIVGEFGFQHGSPPTSIPYETILSECARLGLGYIPWSWKGNNSNVAYLDLSSDWAGNDLTEWGRNVIEGANGIGSTAQKASIFLLGT